MSQGVRAHDLSDDDLRRELAHLKEKAANIAADGTPDQQANHRTRTGELEAEFLRRFLPETEQPAQAPDAPADAPTGAPSTDAPSTDAPSTDAPSIDAPADAPTDDPSNAPAAAPTDDPERPANPA